MTENSLGATPEIEAATPAPEQVATAAPESVEATPAEKPAEAPKSFTQEEVDALIGKRLAREQRKWERQQQLKAAPPPAPAELPPPDQFESVEKYADALASRKAEELLAQRDAQRQQAELLEQYHSREESAREKYEDFEQVAYNPRLPVTEVMAEAIRSSDLGPDVAYYLGSNPKEADRIARLSPFLQAKEIGRLEAKLASSPPPVKQTTRAPAPIAPVTPKSGNTAYDTTDPRSVKNMSTSEWIEAERQRQIRQWEARNR
jgi:hypothetical protein